MFIDSQSIFKFIDWIKSAFWDLNIPKSLKTIRPCS